LTAIEKIMEQLAWRGPSGKVQGHIIITREHAEEIIEMVAAGAGRYWEGRWRDEAKENDRLRAGRWAK
jgi:hypothetical protein